MIWKILIPYNTTTNIWMIFWNNVDVVVEVGDVGNDDDGDADDDGDDVDDDDDEDDDDKDVIDNKKCLIESANLWLPGSIKWRKSL